jgi:methionyl-tRNA synthetase
MSSSKSKFYLTTPIYYVNARPHIGHAYTTIVADVLARRHRLLGDETFFLTGTDEHGQKIERSAAAAGIPPQEFADGVSAQFRALWDRMGLTYDRYIRTTDECHKAGVQKLFTELWDAGKIKLDTYTGAYCVSDEAFVDLPVGTPCPDCGRLLESVTEENFFFKLSEYQLKLLNLIETGELLIEPITAKNEVLSFLRGKSHVDFSSRPEIHGADGVGNIFPTPESMAQHVELDRAAGIINTSVSGAVYTPGALKDISISRSSFTWGIPVPDVVQKASGTTQKHVVYVWLDALANYMTAVGYGSDAPDDVEQFTKLWPADLHLVGKEITRFHCVYWPAFLMAAGLPTPKRITANGWLLFDNAKMSKSRGNVVRTETILEGFGEHVYAKQFPESTKQERDLFASDVLRYFLLREIPFGQDGSFSFDAMVTRYNADLANGYGNLVSRTLSMIQKYSEGVIRVEDRSAWDRNDWLGHAFGLSPGITQWSSPSEPFDSSTMRQSSMYHAIEYPMRTTEVVGGRYGEISFHAQLAEIALAVSMIDGFLSSESPWKLSKQPDSRAWLEEVLYTAAEAIRIVTAMLYPFVPASAAKVWAQLGLGDIEEAARNDELKNLEWGGLKPGTKLGPLAPIFPRADKSLVETMIAMENENASRPAQPLKSADTPTPAESIAASTFDPAAPPRALDSSAEPSGVLSVGGSSAESPERATTPSFSEVQASGGFASPASQTPITAQPTDAATQIGIDDFVKVELRIAQIVVAERIPKADKLLRLEIDLGSFEGGAKRQILSGIAEWYAPEELVGRRIIVITNLAPRKMRGLESHGMLLAASEDGGKPFLATVPEGVPLGTRLK